MTADLTPAQLAALRLADDASARFVHATCEAGAGSSMDIAKLYDLARESLDRSREFFVAMTDPAP